MIGDKANWDSHASPTQCEVDRGRNEHLSLSPVRPLFRAEMLIH